MSKKFWEFKCNTNSTDEADLYLYIEIASWGGGYYAHSAQSFKKELDALGDIKTLNVYINCPGGDVFEGFSIYNMLKRKSQTCKINMFVDGMAASIAGVVLMAGTHISMPSNSMVMIHRASSYIYGNSYELEECIKLLQKIDENQKDTFITRSNGKLDEETLENWLSSGDTWLSAQECFDYGLCDEVTGAIQLSAKYDSKVLGNYKNVPKAFFDEKNRENEPSKPVMDEETKAMIDRIKAKKETWNIN